MTDPWCWYIPIGSMYAMMTFTINIPQMLAYIPYMDPMGYANINEVYWWDPWHTIYGSTMDSSWEMDKWVDCHWLVILTYDSIISFRGILMGSMAHHIWQHHGSVMGNGLIVIGWSSQHMILSSRFGVYWWDPWHTIYGSTMDPSWEMGWLSLAGHLNIWFYHLVSGYIDGIHGTPYMAAPWIRHGKWVDCHWLVISTYDSIISFRGILMGSMAHHIWQHHGSVMGNGLIVIGWSSQHMILSSRFGVYWWDPWHTIYGSTMDPSWEMGWLSLAGHLNIWFYHLVSGYIDGIHGTPYMAAPWIRHGNWVDCHWLVISTYDSIISFRGILMGSMAHHIWQHHGSVMGNGLIVIGWSSQHMILSSRFGVYWWDPWHTIYGSTMDPSWEMGWLSLAGHLNIWFYHLVSGYIDGIHGTPYMAAPWIRHGYRWLSWWQDGWLMIDDDDGWCMMHDHVLV